MELTDLVITAQQGDKQAFDQLVIRFQDMAYASAYATTGEVQMAQDAAQEAFLDAYLNLTQLREPAAFPGWFRRIVLGRSQRQLRNKLLTYVPLDDLPDLDAGSNNPLDLLQQSETIQAVHTAIMTLAPRLRQVVALYYMEGYSQKEIAAYLEKPVSTVKKRLFDARQRLKEGILQMVQAELQAQRPSQNPDFARRIRFFTALLADDLAQVETLLRQDPTLVRATVEWKMALKQSYWPLGATALHLAVARADRAAVELLLAHGADVDNRNIGELTPLHFAAIMQRLEIARQLLKQGATVDVRSNAGQTPLHHAALRGDQAMIRLLLEYRADATLADREGHTPTDLAALRHDAQTVSLLVEHGAGTPMDIPAPIIWTSAHQERIRLITGIKVIDLLTPLPRNGMAGIFTPLAGVGSFSVLCELIAALHEIYDGYAVYLGLESHDNQAAGTELFWQEWGVQDRVTHYIEQITAPDTTRMRLVGQGLTSAQAYREAGHEVLLFIDSHLACTPGVMPYLYTHLGDPFTNAAVTAPAITTPAITTIVHGHHTVGLLPTPLADLTTIITFNASLARQRLYPAIDPIRSESRLFAQALAGSSHAATATQARHLLQRYMDIHPVVESGGVEALWYIDDDPQVLTQVARARRLQRFLTQPFYGASPWTGLVGQLVPLETTLAGVQAILQGDHDALPEEAFRYVGDVTEAVAKARTNQT